MQGKKPVSVVLEHVRKCARSWYGRSWRAHVLEAAHQLFQQKASPALSARQLSAGRRALSALRGFLENVAAAVPPPAVESGDGDSNADASISAALRAVCDLQPRGAALAYGICERTECDGELLNARMDRTPARAFLQAELAAWLRGAFAELLPRGMQSMTPTLVCDEHGTRGCCRVCVT